MIAWTCCFATPGPRLWSDPGRVEALDFRFGPGGRKLAPRAPFQFVREMGGGTSPKVEVRDAAGILWRVKFGSESHPDAFCSRLAWACGYYADPIHYIAEGRMNGAAGLERAKSKVADDGSFREAVFERTPTRFAYLGGRAWSWNDNPFAGSRELNGLKILIMLVSNWDNKDARETDRTGSNVGVLRDRKTGSEIYYVNDWGESLGSWGHHDLTRSRWNCGAFREQSREFAGVDDHGLPHFGFAGHHTDDFKAGLRLDDVRWLLRVLGRVSDGQIRDGLIAAGANAKEVECFTRELRGRISRLQQLTEGRR